ncbi:hypothetical protein [Cellulomonas sp. URHE0023]|uniref:hypothetical protein n=1 Tax=Cellulomonas sp. URHE0023 TaxID=1380354 RepID=UPI0012DFB1CD|nr:hypothetical protein [Cellulomonas sp. URHE0023]
MSESRTVAELLERGLADWVSLHDVVWYSTHGAITPETRMLTQHVLGRLFEEGLMVPGGLAESGFEDWSLPISAWVGRAMDELDRFGWAPMGDGFWLRLTELGRKAAERSQ